MEYFNTFGGNPVSCAIGLAVLDVIRDEGLQAHALEVGDLLLAGLRALMAATRSSATCAASASSSASSWSATATRCEPAGAEAGLVANRMRDLGILMSTDGPFHNVLKIKPPLCFTAGDADCLVSTPRPHPPRGLPARMSAAGAVEQVGPRAPSYTGMAATEPPGRSMCIDDR